MFIFTTHILQPPFTLIEPWEDVLQAVELTYSYNAGRSTYETTTQFQGRSLGRTNTTLLHFRIHKCKPWYHIKERISEVFFTYRVL